MKEALDQFREGKVDILIGTHRVLSRDVRPKELGLLIVDEEQRFGVKQKELLRQLKLRVDVLSLSATPIPRTLQMSLAGLRDISVIETPPEGRRPVRTYVGEYDEELVRAGDRARAGAQAARRSSCTTGWTRSTRPPSASARSCPSARVSVAHGQMDEKQLEKVMLEFLRGDADVLVCTTIVEAGLDIPTANTLIVERADTLGLAQLYQIRGRVGRSRERAYAYLFYPSHAALTEEAQKRLSTLSDYTELGSGFKIAMRDLEIRGAGNLLGEEQSGHVAAVGFELYVAMLDEAVAALAGTSADEAPEPVRLDIPVDAYVPGDYVPYEAAKIEIHRRVAGAREIADLIVLREELEDRFGPVPAPLDNLIRLQDARIKLGRAGAKDVGFRAGQLTVSPIELDSRGSKALREVLPGAIYESGRSTVRVRVPTIPPRASRRSWPPPRRSSTWPLTLHLTLSRYHHASCARHRESRGLARRTSRLSTNPPLILYEKEAACPSHPCARTASSPPWSAAECPPIRSPPSTARRSRRTEFDHWLSVAAKQQAVPGTTAAVPDPPDYTKCVAALQKAPVAKGQAKPTAAALKSQCAQEYDSLKTQVMQFLVQSEWLLKEADKRKINVEAGDRPEAARTTRSSSRSPSRPTSRSSSRRSGMTMADLLFRVKIELLTDQVRQKIVAGTTKVTDAQVTSYYNKNQTRFVAARAARPARRPHQDQGHGRQGEGRAAERHGLVQGRQEVLDRPGLEVPGRQAARRGQGPAGEVLRHCHLRRQEGRGGRPGQDPVRLLRLQGHRDHAGLAADARPRPTTRSSTSSARRAAEHAEQVRRTSTEELHEQDQLREGLRDRRAARTLRSRRRAPAGPPAPPAAG